MNLSSKIKDNQKTIWTILLALVLAFILALLFWPDSDSSQIENAPVQEGPVYKNTILGESGKGLPEDAFWGGPAPQGESVYYRQTNFADKSIYGEYDPNNERAVYYIDKKEEKYIKQGLAPENVLASVSTVYPGSPGWDDYLSQGIPVGPTAKVPDFGVAYFDPGGFRAVVLPDSGQAPVIVIESGDGDKIIDIVNNLQKG